MLKRLLYLPALRGYQLDDPGIFEVEKRIIRSKPFLREIYTEWYGLISEHLPPGDGSVLEIGSGAGFLEEFIPGLILSDVQYRQGISTVFNAQQLPFPCQKLRAIVMCNVLHHIPSVGSFLKEAARCVREDGCVLMVEPWVTKWSSFVYRRLHHEPFDSETSDWNFPANGPLSSANGAMPWILFHRDRDRFTREYPEWSIEDIRPIMPFRYLLSGGVSRRALVPMGAFKFFRGVDHMLSRWPRIFPMFAFIRLARQR
jgi:SAM-dependent methyltransferase